MRSTIRTAACLVALAALANCTSAPVVPDVSRAGLSAAEIATPVIPASARDLDCLSEAVYFEAGGSSVDGRVAVAHVILNRAADPRFPRTVCGVIADGCQFSYRCDGAPDILAEPTRRARAVRTAETVLGGSPDPTGGALFFHAASANPGWFSTRSRIGDFGGNIFYR